MILTSRKVIPGKCSKSVMRTRTRQNKHGQSDGARMEEDMAVAAWIRLENGHALAADSVERHPGVGLRELLAPLELALVSHRQSIIRRVEVQFNEFVTAHSIG